MINFITTGLCLDIIGVVILYFNGPPISPILPDGSELVWYGDDSKKTKEKSKIAKRKILLSKLALIIIVAGFALQLFGQFENNVATHKYKSGHSDTSNHEINSIKAKPPFEKINYCFHKTS